MIELEVPKDIRKYEAKLFGPFTTRQAVCFIAAVVVAIGLYKLFGALMPQDISFFIIMIMDTPLLACGWIKPYGMPFEKFAKVAFVTSFISPTIRKYITENAFAEPIKPATKQKKPKKNKKHQDPNLCAYD